MYIYFSFLAWYYFEESQYVVGEEAGSLTVRIHREGYYDEMADRSVGKYPNM